MEDENVEENFEINNEEPEIKSRANAIEHAERLRTSAQYNGYQELSLAMSSVNDLLYKKKLQKPMARNFGHARAENILTWENLKQYVSNTAVPLNSFRNVEMFYLILFLDAKLDTLIQYMTFRCRYFLRFCSK